MCKSVGLVGLLLVVACSDATPPIVEPMNDAAHGALDTDSDWLCDVTETAIDTDPSDPDSDQDRLPDGVELQHGLNPLDAADPSPAQVVFLRAVPGGLTDVNLHVVVDGAGEAFTGELDAWVTLDGTWPSASHYFTTAIATSADPPDHVFGFPDNGDRIDSVVGVTRLGFRLRFAFTDAVARDCAQAVGFHYAIKRQDGARFGERFYLLVITPDTENIVWCPARSCA